MLVVGLMYALPFLAVGAAYAYTEWSRNDWERARAVERMAEEVALGCIEEALDA